MSEYLEYYESLKKMSEDELDKYFVDRLEASSPKQRDVVLDQLIKELKDYLQCLEYNQAAMDTPEQAIDEMVGAAWETREEYRDWICLRWEYLIS